VTIESDIMATLFARVSSFDIEPARIAWPNVAFTPPADQKYLRVMFVPNSAGRITIDSDGPHQNIGLMQVSLYWTKNGGEAGPRERAAALAAHFPCDLRLDAGSCQVRISKRPDVRDLIVEDAAVQIPVMIAWEAWG
jgi:hypothetical protein